MVSLDFLLIHTPTHTRTRTHTLALRHISMHCFLFHRVYLNSDIVAILAKKKCILLFSLRFLFVVFAGIVGKAHDWDRRRAAAFAGAVPKSEYLTIYKNRQQPNAGYGQTTTITTALPELNDFHFLCGQKWAKRWQGVRSGKVSELKYYVFKLVHMEFVTIQPFPCAARRRCHMGSLIVPLAFCLVVYAVNWVGAGACLAYVSHERQPIAWSSKVASVWATVIKSYKL